jgi:hypothetical protein
LVPIGGKVIHDGFVFHNLHLSNWVELEFATERENYQLDRSGSNVVHYELQSGKICPSLSVIAGKPLSLNEMLSAISRIDIYKSLHYLGPKDILLLGIIVSFMILLPFAKGVSGQ